MEELYGILTAYELRLGIDKYSKEEVAFKVIKKTKNQKQTSQANHHEESDVEEANFIKKLQKGSGKYKWQTSFQMFQLWKSLALCS